VGDLEARHANLRGRDDLPALLAEVRRTRTAQHERQRLVPASAEGMLPTRQASLRALEAYAGALDRHGWPLPARMRLDMQLLRSLCGRNVFRP
jgi:hypothetical protein